MDLRFEINEVGEVKKQFRVRGYEKDTTNLVLQYFYDTYEEVFKLLKEYMNKGE